jgi:hypothetical protein
MQGANETMLQVNNAVDSLKITPIVVSESLDSNNSPTLHRPAELLDSASERKAMDFSPRASPSAESPREAKHADSKAAASDSRASSTSENQYYPFASWEQAAFSALLVRGRTPRSELDLLLRTLREPGFDCSKLPTSCDELDLCIRKLPIPRITQCAVDIYKRGKNGERKLVDSQPTFYFDLEETIRTMLADPMILPTLNFDSSRFHTSNFGRSPLLASTLVDFYFRDADTKSTAVASIGDFVQHSDRRISLITSIEALAGGGLIVHGEQFRHDHKQSQRGELVRTSVMISAAVDNIDRKLDVFWSADVWQRYVRRQEPRDEVDPPTFWTNRQVVAQLRSKLRFFDCRQHQQRLKEVLSLPVNQRPRLFVKVFLDGESVVCIRADLAISQTSLYSKLEAASWADCSLDYVRQSLRHC